MTHQMRKYIGFSVAITFIFVLLSIFTCAPIIGYSQSRVEINFVYLNKTHKYIDEDIIPSDHTVAEEIHTRKINAPLSQKLFTVDKCRAAGSTWEKAIGHSFPLLSNTVEKIVSECNLPYTDSEILFQPSSSPMFTIKKEREGRETDREEIYKNIYFALRRGSSSTVRVIPKVLVPAVKATDNIGLIKSRAKFSTSFSTSGENRSHNVTLALSKINGTVLLPGEEFSFNKVVGRRTAENGFREAKIIVEGQYIDGTGGGVCQVATTIYNAALRADMNITEVRNHSLAPSYVPPSFDAMVSAYSSDFKFVNSTKSKIFIKAYAEKARAIVELYGAQMTRRIVPESVVISTDPPPVDNEIIDVERKYVSPFTPAQTRVRVSYGHSALKSEGYVRIYDDQNRLLERKFIRKDSYKSTPGLVAIAP